MKKPLLLVVGVLLNVAYVLALPTDSIRINTTDSLSYTTSQEQQKDLSDSLNITLDSLAKSQPVTIPVVFKPDPQKSLWYAIIFPGLGQIYNRQYWKVPIVYGGVAGLTYAISWNGKYYRDYSRGYRDIMDSDPNTKSYEKLLPYSIDPSSSEAKNLMKSRQNTYRRYRDLSIVGAVAFYAITVIDAYVDAELSSFDITPDLSMKVEPTIINNRTQAGKSVGLQCSFRF